MTRKHFQALAYALWQTRPTGTERSRYGTADTETARAALSVWQTTRSLVADACAAANGNFDRGRFFMATEAENYSPGMHGR